MDIGTIVYVVFVTVGIICYIVSTALAIKRKKVSGVPQAEIDEFTRTEFNRVVNYIVDAEAKYKAVFREGVKAGAFKLKDVLDLIREDCLGANIIFDKAYWTNTINNIVECANHTKEIQSTQVDQKVNIKGVQV